MKVDETWAVLEEEETHHGTTEPEIKGEKKY